MRHYKKCLIRENNYFSNTFPRHTVGQKKVFGQRYKLNILDRLKCTLSYLIHGVEQNDLVKYFGIAATFIQPLWLNTFCPTVVAVFCLCRAEEFAEFFPQHRSDYIPLQLLPALVQFGCKCLGNRFVCYHQNSVVAGTAFLS